jgi:outer membrane biosynthesis protein TonB
VVPSVPTSPAAKVTSSTSASGQFVVHGPDLATRSGFSSRCDEVAERLRRLLRDQQPWVLPVVVALKTGSDVDMNEPAVRTSIGKMTQGGFHLQLTVQARPGLSAADFHSELVRILLAERILRNQNDITSKRSRVLPEWLLTGTTQALTFRERSRPSAVFAAVFKSGKIYGIEEILQAAPGDLDALSRTIYETSCCALVLALLDQPEGAARFQKFLGSLATDSREDRELLAACFPGLAESGSSLNKWWSLQMASLATPGVFEHMGPTETLKAMDQALVFRYEGTARARAASAAKKSGDDTEEPAEEEPKKGRGLFGWLFGKSDGKSDGEEGTASEEAKAADTGKKSEPPKEEEKKKEKDKDEPEKPKPAPPKEPEKKEQEPPPPAKEKEPPAKSTPKKGAKKGEAKGEATEEPEKKRGSALNPLNWFRGKKDEEKKQEDEAPKAKEDSAAVPGSVGAGAALLSSASIENLGDWAEAGTCFANTWLFALGQTLGFSESRQVDLKLPLFKRKPKDESASKEEESKDEGAKNEAKPASRKEEPTKDEEPKPEPEPKKSKKKDEEPEPPEESEAKPPRKPAPEKPRTVSLTIPIEDYASIMKRSDRSAIIKRTAASLNLLLPRANVLLRPVIVEYIAALAELQEGKTKGMDERLAAIRARKKAAYERAKAVEDYLDWMEASEGEDYSGTFDDFLSLPSAIQKELPPRADPLSKYLDAVNAEFEK